MHYYWRVSIPIYSNLCYAIIMNMYVCVDVLLRANSVQSPCDMTIKKWSIKGEAIFFLAKHPNSATITLPNKVFHFYLCQSELESINTCNCSRATWCGTKCRSYTFSLKTFVKCCVSACLLSSYNRGMKTLYIFTYFLCPLMYHFTLCESKKGWTEQNFF